VERALQLDSAGQGLCQVRPRAAGGQGEETAGGVSSPRNGTRIQVVGTDGAILENDDRMGVRHRAPLVVEL
jgi:hypothetical protein